MERELELVSSFAIQILIFFHMTCIFKMEFMSATKKVFPWDMRLFGICTFLMVTKNGYENR